MEQYISQEEIWRIIISDMVKKRNVFVKSNADMLACMLRREIRRMKSHSIIPLVFLRADDMRDTYNFEVI